MKAPRCPANARGARSTRPTRTIDRPSGRRRTRPRRRFGQHFLEPAWISKLLDRIEPGPDDLFLEVGPGRGALTLPLARRSRHVTGIEIDRDLGATLRRDAPSNVTIITGNVLEVDLEGIISGLEEAIGHPSDGRRPHRVRVVGNLPYGISSPILFRLTRLARARPVLDAHVLLQKEVADRLAAPPGTKAYGPLGILVRIDADIARLLSLPPGAFRPVPGVTSELVRLRFRRPLVAPATRTSLERLVRALFTRRRKTLANALAPIVPAASATDVLDRLAIDPRRRPETLDLAELAALADALAAAAGAQAVL
jgi:16S rRNA (adenine1518-N6/adenine1519-N6)-dimethyltransferase